MRVLTAGDVIRKLGLKPLDREGGFFRETYRSEIAFPQEVLPDGYIGPRAVSSAIYYLLTPESFSALHRLPGDEIFHFYMGDPVEMLQLGPDGTGRKVVMGHDLTVGMLPQLLVPAGVWQGTRLREDGRFALFGTTMAPGFDFQDLEIGTRAALIEMYPTFARDIVALTRS